MRVNARILPLCQMGGLSKGTAHSQVMLKIGKLSQQAIAAATYLAERYDEEGGRVSAAEIADARELPRPVVAKLLAALSLHRLTTGTTGPTGGYRLARPPESITLFDIVEVFERMDIRPMCPFGPNWCGNGAPCPLHDAISVASEQVADFLRGQNLSAFRKSAMPTSRGRALPAAKKKAARKKASRKA